MDEAFVDAAAWIALLNRSDDLHARAVAVRKELYRTRTSLVTTEFVLMEVADALSSPPLRSHIGPFLRGLRQTPMLTLVPADSSLFAEGLALYEQRPDKDWSLTDCSSFTVMSHRGIRTAFTSDRHFVQAGFVKLL